MRAKATWVALFFISSAFLCAYVFNLAFTDLFRILRVENQPLLGERFTVASLVGVVLAGSIAFYCGVLNRRTRELVEQCIVELEKVAWPSWAQTKVATITVIATSFVGAMILGVFDTLFAWLTAQNLFLR